jgi:hypothetical protein
MHDSDPPSLDGADSTMSISVKKCGGRTHAKVELHWAGGSVAGTGVAFRHPADCLTDEVGQKLATARALSDLADRLHVAVNARVDRAARLLAVER